MLDHSEPPTRQDDFDDTGAEPGTSEADQDVTLGGYYAVHNRPPAFEAEDGQPYTVSVEVEQTGDLRAPFAGYLIFPKWAASGVGIIGHVETSILWTGRASADIRAQADALSLFEVQCLLNTAVQTKEDV